MKKIKKKLEIENIIKSSMNEKTFKKVLFSKENLNLLKFLNNPT
jgi:hypothetical protein